MRTEIEIIVTGILIKELEEVKLLLGINLLIKIKWTKYDSPAIFIKTRLF